MKTQIYLTSLVMLISSCADRITSENLSGCQKDLQDRQYEKAIESCENRQQIAEAHMGFAGFRVPAFLNREEVKPNTDTNATRVLGKEDVSLANVTVNSLELSNQHIPHTESRVSRIQRAKQSFDSVIELFDGQDDLNNDEKILYVFATVFGSQLEMVLLLDIGKATSIKATTEAALRTEVATLIANNKSPIITQLNNGEEVSEVLKQGDGRLWDQELRMAMLPSSATINVPGVGNRKLDIGGNLEKVCQSISGSSSSTTSPDGRSIDQLLDDADNAAAQFGELVGSDSLKTLQEAIEATRDIFSGQQKNCQALNAFL